MLQESTWLTTNYYWNSTAEQNNRSGLRSTSRTEDKPTPDRLSINLFWTHTKGPQPTQQYCITCILASWSCFRSCTYRICIHFMTSVMRQLDIWVLPLKSVPLSPSSSGQCVVVFFKVSLQLPDQRHGQKAFFGQISIFWTTRSLLSGKIWLWKNTHK